MTTALLEWGVAARPLEGEVESGDRHVVQPFPHGVLVGAIDGLGHGTEAATAARLATETLQRQPQGNLIALVTVCHERLRDTRGVVMSLAWFSALEHTLTWLGVGNVEGLLLRHTERGPETESLLLRGGLVGGQLPPLMAAVLPLRAGDMVVLATDGIAGDFRSTIVLHDPPQKVADRILARHGKTTDDALVLVARYRGVP